jgi:hypothetical protein
VETTLYLYSITYLAFTHGFTSVYSVAELHAHYFVSDLDVAVRRPQYHGDSGCFSGVYDVCGFKDHPGLAGTEKQIF